MVAKLHQGPRVNRGGEHEMLRASTWFGRWAGYAPRCLDTERTLHRLRLWNKLMTVPTLHLAYYQCGARFGCLFEAMIVVGEFVGNYSDG